MAYVKPLSVIHTTTGKGVVTWEFLCVNNHYFATNYRGGHHDAKSFKDLMRLKAIMLSYKKADGSARFNAGYPRKAQSVQTELPIADAQKVAF